MRLQVKITDTLETCVDIECKDSSLGGTSENPVNAVTRKV